MNDKIMLIIDDDEKIVRMLERRLKKIGIIPHIAINGAIGLEKIFELKPDLVLLDMQMPVLDGYTMIKTLRQMKYKGLVVACTASVRAEDTKSTLEAGCNYFMAKPIGYDFEDKIRSFLAM